MAGIDWQKLQKSFALCQAGLISKSLTLEFQISKVVTVDFGLLHFGKLLTQHSAGSNTVWNGFWLKWLDLSALDYNGKDSAGLIWLDLDSSGWLERRLKDNQDYLVYLEARWIPPPLSPNDCVVIRRLVAVITDYWGGYSSCHTHAPTLSKAPTCHFSCHTVVTCDQHVTCDVLKRPVFVAHLFRLCLVAGFTSWLQSCNSLLTKFNFFLLQNKKM